MFRIMFWLIISYVCISGFEYVIHRWFMHSDRWFSDIYNRHTKLHHGRFYRQFTNDHDPAARYLGLALDPGYTLFWSSPIWLTLYFSGFVLGAVILAFSIGLHSIVWTAVHTEMHEPSGKWFSTLRVYKYWLKYHYAHHKHVNSNFNILLPGMDHLFGTNR